jgi:hypothetical protein
MDHTPHEAIDWVPATGSCVRCGRALDLASAKVDGRWYGNALCATGAPCPLDHRDPAVPESWLTPRPRRFFGQRAPRELRHSARSLGDVARS